MTLLVIAMIKVTVVQGAANHSLGAEQENFHAVTISSSGQTLEQMIRLSVQMRKL